MTSWPGIPVRAADVLNYLFLLFVLTLCLLYAADISGFSTLLVLYLLLLGGQALLITVRNRNRLTRFCYDLVFPVLCVIAVFDSLGEIIRGINPGDVDPFLIRFDYLLLNGYPTVMMERFSAPLLTDVMVVFYVSYYFLPVILGLVLMRQKNRARYDHALFLIMLCFYLSYVGYMLMPALGPRYSMNHLQTVDLGGALIADEVRALLDALEGIKRDAFPSGHTAVALVVLYLARKADTRLFAVFIPVVSMLIVSTVYCRYHYVVDILAGVVLAAISVLIGEYVHGYGKQGKHSHRRG